MRFVPFRYTLRSLIVRAPATLLTIAGIGATVAVVAGVLALQQGFSTLYSENGRDDLFVFLRKGSSTEGLSIIQRDGAAHLIKSRPEVRENAAGLPMAAAESFLAVRRFKVGGGETNVAVRGVQPMRLEIEGDRLEVLEGEMFSPGADEVVVGADLVGRIENCQMGEVITFNTTPFTVVGIFKTDGPASSEIWGDSERIMDALDRPSYSRVIAMLKPEVNVEEFKASVEQDNVQAAIVKSEREYLSAQTRILTFLLFVLGSLLAIIMGIAAVFTATNTMLSAISSRTYEIGILLSIGFRPFAVFFAFVVEALLLGLLGGLIGCLVVLPLNGIETGAGNFDTFTEVSFAFRITPMVLGIAVGFSILLGFVGGLIPAFQASRLLPTEALRRG